MNDMKRKSISSFDNNYDASIVKWCLPMFLWQHITKFLLPEENIKLSLVNYSEHAYLLNNKGEFLIPPTTLIKQYPSPTWYSRQKFILNFESWNKCPSHALDRYFNCIVKIEKANIDGRCAQLPMKNILSFLYQSDTTLTELSITTFPHLNENTCFYQPCSDGSIDILQLMKPFEKLSTKKKLFKLQKLKSLHIQGPFALLWIQILGWIDMKDLTHLSIELPPVCDTTNSSYLREIKKIITDFLFNFPNGQHFHLTVSPNDRTMYMITKQCIAWIGSGSPSSKSFQSVKFESSNLNTILDSLKSHFYWILMKLNCPTSLLNNIKLLLLVASTKSNELCLKDDCKACKYFKNENVQHMLQLFDILRSNLSLLKKIEFVGPITTWESFIYLKIFLGKNVRLVVKNVEINIFNEWVSYILYFTMDDVVTLKLQASLSSPTNPIMFGNQNVLFDNKKNSKHFNMESSCQYVGARFQKFVFKNLSTLIVTNVSVDNSQKLLDLTSRFIVRNASTFLENEFMDIFSHKQTLLNNDAQEKKKKSTKFRAPNNFPNERNSEQWSFSNAEESHLSLEIWFSDLHVLNDKKYKQIKTNGDKSIKKFHLQFVRRILKHFSVISVIIYPCPTISVFDEYHELLRASHYLIKNFTLEQTGDVSLYLTSTAHDDLESHGHSELPVITHLTLESLDAIEWILRFLTANKYSYSFKNLQYLNINLLPETHIGLSMFFVDFLTKRNINISNINTFLDHSNLYSLINSFSDTLDFITITYHLPLMVHMIPTHVASCFFLSCRKELERNLNEALYNNSSVTMDIRLNSLDSLYLFQFLEFMDHTIQLCDEIILDMTTRKQREFNFLHQHQQFCQKEKNLVPLITQKNIDLNTIKRNKFMTALVNLGVECEKDSNEEFNLNGGLIHKLPKFSNSLNESESQATIRYNYSLRKQYPSTLCYIESLLQLLSDEEAATRESLREYEKEDEFLSEEECHKFYRFLSRLENQLKKSFSVLLYYAQQYEKMSCNRAKDENVFTNQAILNYKEKKHQFGKCYSKGNVNENQFWNVQIPTPKSSTSMWDFNNIFSSASHDQSNVFKNTFHHNPELENSRVDEINCSHWLPFQWNYHDSNFNKTVLCQPDINGGKFTLTIIRKNK